MKKFFIVSALLAALCAALLAAAAAWFFGNEPLHAKIVNSLLSDCGAKVESAHIAPSRLRAKNISLSAGSAKITAKEFVFEYSLTRLFAKKLCGAGKLEGVEIIMEEDAAAQPPADTAASSAAAPQPQASPFALPFEIHISSFAADAQIIRGANRASARAQIKNLSLARNKSEFDISASIDAGGAKYSLSAKKSAGALNILAESGGAQIFAASANIGADFMSGGGKAKLSADNRAFQPAARALGIGLPEFSAETFAEISFDIPHKKYSANVAAKISASGISKLKGAGGVPFDTLDFSATAAIALENSRLKISGLESNLGCGGSGVASLRPAGAIELDLDSLKPSDWFDVGVLTVSVPPSFIDKKIENAEFSADNISGEFLISANKIPQIKISTKKPANIINAKLAQNGATLAERLTLFLEAAARADFRAASCAAEAKLQSAVVDGKRMQISLNAEWQNGKTSCQISADGCLNPVIYSINSISSNISEALYAKAGAKIDFGESVEISQLSASIASGSPQGAAVEISAPQKIVYSPAKRAFECGAQARVKAAKFPFALFRPFAGGIDAKTVSCDALVSLKGASASVSATASAEDLSVSNGAQNLADDLNLSAKINASFDIQKRSSKIALSDFSLGNSSGNMCVGEARAALSALSPLRLESAEILLNAQLPPIFALPSLAKYNNLARAGASAKIALKPSAANAEIKISNLAARASARDIQTLRADISASWNKDIQVSAALNINSARGKTDAKARLTKPDGAPARVELDAKNLVLDDLLLLKSAFTNDLYVEKSQPAAARAIRRPDRQTSLEALKTKDATPFWGAGAGYLCEAKIGSLGFDGADLLNDFTAQIEASPLALQISKLGAELYGGKLSGAVKITFDPAKSAPYALQPSALSLDNFDISKISKPGFLAGVFSAKIEARGPGNNLAHLADTAAGKAVLSGKNGSIRLIDTDADIGQKIGLAQAAAKLLNEFAKNKAVGGALSLVETFSKIDFETARIELSRDEKTLDINLDSAAINAHNLSIKSKKGALYYDPSRGFKQRDLDVEMSIYTNNSQIISMLKSVRALVSDGGESGLAISESFKIYGTLENPKTNLLDILTGSPVISQPVKLLKQLQIFK